MKILHIDSGLGNQMLGYCEYLAMQMSNPEDVCCIETLIYEIPEFDATISQWNGYELERVFGIKVPNLKDLISAADHQKLKDDLIRSECWKKNWNFSPYLTESLKSIGIEVVNNCYVKDENAKMRHSLIIDLIRKMGYDVWKYRRGLNRQKKDVESYVKQYDDRKTLFYKTDKNVLSGQRFSFIHTGNDIELIDRRIRESFVFPPITDEKNKNLVEQLRNEQSVAIHARRGDMLTRSGMYYSGGYFKRAVKYIKQHVENPTFYFFSDPGSCEWCMNHKYVFGLTESDKITCVNWNKGQESFRDMQLMAQCKHNIVTNSSFGWWGAYLNENPSKITCSPDYSYLTTHHF